MELKERGSLSMEIFGKKLGKNKKGSLLDIVFIAIALTFFSIVVLVGLKIATEFENNIDTNDLFATGEARSNVENVRVKYTHTIDNTFLFLLIFMAIATLALAALVAVHPLFIPFFFIGWVIVIFLSGILSNIYQAMAGDSNLSAIANNLTFMNKIMIALPIIVGVFGIILLSVMYKISNWGNQ